MKKTKSALTGVMKKRYGTDKPLKTGRRPGVRSDPATWRERFLSNLERTHGNVESARKQTTYQKSAISKLRLRHERLNNSTFEAEIQQIKNSIWEEDTDENLDLIKKRKYENDLILMFDQKAKMPIYKDSANVKIDRRHQSINLNQVTAKLSDEELAAINSVMEAITLPEHSTPKALTASTNEVKPSAILKDSVLVKREVEPKPVSAEVAPTVTNTLEGEVEETEPVPVKPSHRSLAEDRRFIDGHVFRCSACASYFGSVPEFNVHQPGCTGSKLEVIHLRPEIFGGNR